MLHPSVSLPRLFPRPSTRAPACMYRGSGDGAILSPTQHATVHVCYTQTFLSPSTCRGTVCVLPAVHSLHSDISLSLYTSCTVCVLPAVHSLHSDISLSLYTTWYSMCVTSCTFITLRYFSLPLHVVYSMCVTSCTFSSVWTAPVLTSLIWTPALQRSSPDIWCSIYLKLSLETPPTLVRLIGTTRNSGDGCPL